MRTVTKNKSLTILEFLILILFFFNLNLICQENPAKFELELIINTKLKDYIPLEVQYSPDGKYFFGKAFSGSFDPKTGELKASIMDQINFVYDIINNKRIISFEDTDILGMSSQNYLIIKKDGIKLWDFKKDKEIKYLFDVNDKVYISMDGMCAASVLDEKEVIITNFNPNQETVKYIIEKSASTLDGFFFKDSSSFWMVSHSDKQIKIQNLIDNKTIAMLNFENTGLGYWCFSLSGNVVAVSRDESVFFFDVDKALFKKSVKLYFTKTALRLSNDGSQLFIGGASGEVAVFDIKSEVIKVKINNHISIIRSLSVSPVENSFITASYDSTIKLWKIVHNQSYTDIKDKGGFVYTDENSVKLPKYSEPVVNGSLEKQKQEEAEQHQREETSLIKEQQKAEAKHFGEQSRLRSGYKTVSFDEIKSFLNRYGFYNRFGSKSKSFKNEFEKRIVNGDEVVVDHATGLMWQQGGI